MIAKKRSRGTTGGKKNNQPVVRVGCRPDRLVLSHLVSCAATPTAMRFTNPRRYASAKAHNNDAGTSPRTSPRARNGRCSPDTSATGAAMTPSTSGRSGRSRRVRAVGPTTTSDERPETDATRPHGQSATAESASATGASRVGAATRRSPPGRTAIPSTPTCRLTSCDPGGSNSSHSWRRSHRWLTSGTTVR